MDGALVTTSRRQWQRECHKTIGFLNKNNCSARAFYILVHFFALLQNSNVTRPNFEFSAERDRESFFFLTLTLIIIIFSQSLHSLDTSPSDFQVKQIRIIVREVEKREF